jgi:hypothetical protein
MRPAILDGKIATFDPAEFSQPAQKRGSERTVVRRRNGTEIANCRQPSRLFGAQGEWPEPSRLFAAQGEWPEPSRLFGAQGEWPDGWAAGRAKPRDEIAPFCMTRKEHSQG